MSLFWLSFADPSRPKGAQFLGACVIVGATLIDAVKNAHIFGCNPGGEVMGTQIPKETEALIQERWKRRRLTFAECQDLDAELAALRAVRL